MPVNVAGCLGGTEHALNWLQKVIEADNENKNKSKCFPNPIDIFKSLFLVFCEPPPKFAATLTEAAHTVKKVIKGGLPVVNSSLLMLNFIYTWILQGENFLICRCHGCLRVEGPLLSPKTHSHKVDTVKWLIKIAMAHGITHTLKSQHLWHIDGRGILSWKSLHLF